jgi:hypothetical protein
MEKLIQQLQLSTELSTLLVRIKGNIEELIDSIKYYPEERKVLFDRKKKLENETNEIISKISVIDTFLKNPLVIIRDRMDCSDLIWDVTQSGNAYNSRCMVGIFENTIGLKSKQNILTKPVGNALELTSRIKIIDMFVWRVGIYNILLLLIAYFWWCKRKSINLVILIPIVGNTISLILAMGAQDYRYVYYTFVLFWFILFFTLTSIQKDKFICDNIQGAE